MSLKTEFINQRKKKGSLIAFNVQNITHLEILRNVVELTSKPVIAQFSARYIQFWEDRIGIEHLVHKYQNNGIYFFLDHCLNKKIIATCIDAGFAGVMFDGSSMPIEDNCKTINEINEYKNNRILETILEVEIGAIKGVEDGHVGSVYADYYDQDELDFLVKESKFDILALGIGNAHGVYESLSNIKPELLKIASDKYPELNLVLHGGTGLPEEMIIKCIEYGVVKINVSTQLKIETHLAMIDYTRNSETYNENEWYEFVLMHLKPCIINYISKYTK